MTFIEFKRRDGTRFLIDFASHWEIDDKGDKPATPIAASTAVVFASWSSS